MQAIDTFDHAPSVPAAMSINPQTFVATAPATFIAGEEVVFWYNLPDGTAVTFPEVTNAQADGSLNVTLSQAAYTAILSNAVNLVAQGLESNHQALYTFGH